jgi:hypothetical protein
MNGFGRFPLSGGWKTVYPNACISIYIISEPEYDISVVKVYGGR